MNYAENTSQISLRTESHVAQINTLNQPGLLASQTSQMASVPFHKAQIASINNPASSQAAQQAISSNIHTSKSSSTPHSVRPDLIISSFSNPQTSNKKFEPKSIIWADSISRGLVDLNISGPRINPLANIGIDFNDINRKEKRNEAKSSQTRLSSSSSMGKAMGAGSGLGRAATGMYAQPQNTAMEMNQPYMGMGMGANIGMTHPSSGMPRQGPACRGAYNPMNARGGYGQYHPYGHGGHG
ncbi:clathrin interactor EPSIN 3-like [Phalaenopsis equestris]|uniref:clathrin interactor EPSIN 3-like n=1 Tax=Phalaenopsis equestris TaxID=78828 RepID=UPI0009E59B8C|nr:clathrin interactor EPSIN 3-like [Phalaenopsis equestris]